MKNYALFNYDFLFQDYFSKISKDAKLLYIEMMFFANNGFVANPKTIIDSRGYQSDALIELIKNGEVLVLPERSEIFITSFYVHNKGVDPFSWTRTPYYPYWRGKLFIKKENRIATFKKQGESTNNNETEKITEVVKPSVNNESYNWEELLKDLV